MSSHYAIAAVSVVLRRLLSTAPDGLDAFGNVLFTALPPDRIQLTPNEPSQLNLFMYQVTPNQGWRNVGMPSHNAKGERLTNPPLGLDLHYLLTAYGAEEFFAEALLGYGMQVLHDTPVLTRAFIHDTWSAGGLTPPEQALADSNLADQIEQIKICPQYVNNEELSKLWTAFQAKYRPSMAYQVSVVLLEGARPTRSALPVLRQGREDRGPIVVAPPFPSLTRVYPARSEQLPAVRLGDDLAVIGEQMNDSLKVRITHTRLPISFELDPAPARTQLTLSIADPATDVNVLTTWAIGFYTLALVVRRPDLPAWTTNEVPFALAPTIAIALPPGSPAPLTVAAGDVVMLTCAPRIRPEQERRIVLLLGMQPVANPVITTPADVTQPTTLSFTVPAVAADEYVVRLRVDGVDSLPVLITGTPPRLDFDAQQKVRVA
jgi:hypothetical protein